MPPALRVIHLVPYDGPGGVEVAARSMLSSPRDEIEFRVLYIDCLQRTRRFARHPANSPLAYVRVARRLWSDRPNVLICSLWRSAIVGIIAKLVCRELRLVCFLHAERPVHLVDWAIHKVLLRLAEEVWSNSAVTLKSRVGRSRNAKTRIISMRTEKIKATTGSAPQPSFVFWGRLAPAKGT